MENITISIDEITSRGEMDGKIIVESNHPLEGINPIKSRTVKIGRFCKEEKRFYTTFDCKREFELYLSKYKLQNVTGISYLPPEVNIT